MDNLTVEIALKWTGEVKLFEKQYLFIPINETLHWLLAIVCFPADNAQNPENISKKGTSRSRVLIFDSLNLKGTRAASAIRK